MKFYHNKFIIILWAYVCLILNISANDLQAMEVSKKEISIEAFQQLIQRKDINILVVRSSQQERILQNVINFLF
jgi:hypothetical protein